jgi:predicted transcriptional regulator
MRSPVRASVKEYAVVMADELLSFFDANDVEELLELHARSIYRLLNELYGAGFLEKRLGLNGEPSIYTFKFPE